MCIINKSFSMGIALGTLAAVVAGIGSFAGYVSGAVESVFAAVEVGYGIYQMGSAVYNYYNQSTE